MAKILMVFGSSTGNTENIAHLLEGKFKAQGHSVTVLNAAEAEPEHLAKGYDLVLLGASAWGEEDIEMQDDFASFFEEAGSMDLSGVKLAAFASGDSSYPHFCGAVDVIEEKGKELGAILVASGLRLEGDGQDSDAEISDFASEVMRSL